MEEERKGTATDIQSLFSIKNKIVVVTGGGYGIGKMITHGFVENGAKVYIVGRKKEVVENTAKEFNEKLRAGRCFAFTADLSTEEGCLSFVTDFSQLETHLDVLVNNAGCNWAAPLSEYPASAFDKVLNLNVKAVFFLTRAFVPLLSANATQTNPSRVINIGSIDDLERRY